MDGSHAQTTTPASTVASIRKSSARRPWSLAQISICNWILTSAITLHIIVNMHGVNAIYPEYELDRRIPQVLQAIQNAFDDTNPRVLQKDASSLVTFRCKQSTTSPFVQVQIGDRNIGREMNLGQPVVLLIHGWFDSHDRVWINGTATIWQTFMEANVCSVDWSRLALTEYFIAANNTRLVAAEVVRFLEFMQEEGVHLDNVTLVGHSFGAQVAGYAGALMGGRIGRIFGLDPAGWAFTKPTVVDEFHRLDRNDAKYVQCIHTNRNFLGLGTHMPCGHQDFYPNNGLAPQPGCLHPREEGGASLLITSCSHFKALEFFAMSLDPRTKLKGWRCAKGYDWWRLGMCKSKNFDYLGIHSRNKVPGKLYLHIEARLPFVL